MTASSYKASGKHSPPAVAPALSHGLGGETVAMVFPERINRNLPHTLINQSTVQRPTPDYSTLFLFFILNCKKRWQRCPEMLRMEEREDGLSNTRAKDGGDAGGGESQAAKLTCTCAEMPR